VGVCPFTIAVYVLKAEPETVYVAYQPVVIDAGAATVAEAMTLQQEINDMLAEVARNALE